MLLIFPLNDKPDWRNPPLITMLLVLINVLVFFGPQSHDNTFIERWASNPSQWKPITTITSMFLHGSVSHLLGNMVFLFIFGYTVEKTLGEKRYLAYYLLAGIGGALCDVAVRWGSTPPALGASGAISGLMAMYVVLYGKRSIKFFYMLLFYFDYVRGPAIILLPVWIGHELFQHWFGNEGIAYMAHAGGLVTGAFLIVWHKYHHPHTEVPLSEPPPDPYMEELARAKGLVKKQRYDEARDAFARLAAARPRDCHVVSRYFNLALLAPATEDFHRAAALVLALKDTDAPTSELIYESFRFYMKTAKHAARFAPDDLARLSMRFSRDGHGADAEGLARTLLDRAPEHPELPGVLLAAANALRRQGAVERADELKRELRERFPQSPEARWTGDC